MNIYVGNLPYSMNSEQLQETFAAHGTVKSATVITDSFSGKSKGFGFVEMDDDNEAKSAITALNDADIGGRMLRVNEARPRQPRYNKD